MILLFFFIDYASERNESLLSDYRAQLILCKDYASERNESLLSDCRAQLIYAKIYFSSERCKKFIGKCLRVKEITEKAKKIDFLLLQSKELCTFAKTKTPGSSPASNNLGEGLTGTALQR